MPGNFIKEKALEGIKTKVSRNGKVHIPVTEIKIISHTFLYALFVDYNRVYTLKNANDK